MADARDELKGAAWQKHSEAAGTYYSGKVTVNGTEYFINIFRNKHKEEGDRKPDLNILLKPKDGDVAKAQEVFTSDIPF
jgi:hypothetical protein